MPEDLRVNEALPRIDDPRIDELLRLAERIWHNRGDLRARFCSLRSREYWYWLWWHGTPANCGRSDGLKIAIWTSAFLINLRSVSTNKRRMLFFLRLQFLLSIGNMNIKFSLFYG